MSDQNAERNQQLKATMSEKNSANLNRSGKEGVVVRSPKQVSKPNRPTGHVDPYTGKRS